MTQPKETEMDTNENICTNTPEDVIVLGVASVETKGGAINTEGVGGQPMPGISED
jgi:hypothetical protein